MHLTKAYKTQSNYKWLTHLRLFSLKSDSCLWTNTRSYQNEISAFLKWSRLSHTLVNSSIEPVSDFFVFKLWKQEAKIFRLKNKTKNTLWVHDTLCAFQHWLIWKKKLESSVCQPIMNAKISICEVWNLNLCIGPIISLTVWFYACIVMD